MNTTLIKLVLAILLLLCLAPMPYGYYQLVRFAGLIGFGILAYTAHQEDKQTEMIIYGALALLFQPFIKISIGRELWNVVDVVVAVGLIVTLLKEKNNSK